MSSRILNAAESQRKVKYPRAGEPILADGVTLERERVRRYLPHIETGEGEGIYLNYWVDGYERAWEIAMQKSVEMRTIGKIKETYSGIF